MSDETPNAGKQFARACDQDSGMTAGEDPAESNYHALFQAKFGLEGEMLITPVIGSHILRAGGNPETPEKFAGLQFSLPLSAYLAYRALRPQPEKKDKAYEIFSKNVKAAGARRGLSVIEIPTQEFIEDLAADPLANLERVSDFKAFFPQQVDSNELKGLIAREQMHGGAYSAYPTDYFDSTHTQIGLMLYFIDRALDPEENPNDTYIEFVNNVNCYAAHSGLMLSTEDLAPRTLVEALTRAPLSKLHYPPQHNVLDHKKLDTG